MNTNILFIVHILIHFNIYSDVCNRCLCVCGWEKEWDRESEIEIMDSHAFYSIFPKEHIIEETVYVLIASHILPLTFFASIFYWLFSILFSSFSLFLFWFGEIYFRVIEKSQRAFAI